MNDDALNALEIGYLTSADAALVFDVAKTCVERSGVRSCKDSYTYNDLIEVVVDALASVIGSGNAFHFIARADYDDDEVDTDEEPKF